MARGVHINPGMLRWAREAAGLSVEEATAKLGLKDTRKASAAEKLREAEDGRRPVSRSFLERATGTYRRPLLTFYLAGPPEVAPRSEDFRSVSGGVSRRDNASLDALLRDLRARQQMVREILAEEEDVKPLDFIGSSRIEDGVTAVAARIRATLRISIAEQRSARNPLGLFARLRSATESIGVFVLLLGDLGSHHSDIGEDVFRGVALADELAPFVVINDNDAAVARSFTLIHELAHLWIGASGVSGPVREVSSNVAERFCNDVAGEFLLPPEELVDLSGARGTDVAAVLSLSDSIARSWNVSQGVVIYRLARNGWISEAVASALFASFAERWRNERQRARAHREENETGPGYYQLRRSKLGTGLLDVVRRALARDVVTHTRAARILGVSPAAVEPLLRERPRAA